jgi:superfamily I DNA/RNA helicase
MNKKFGYLRLNQNRDKELVSKVSGQLFESSKDKFLWLATIKYLAHIKQELIPPTFENLELLQYKYSDLSQFPIHSKMIEQINQLIPVMKDFKSQRSLGMTFDDQIWGSLFNLPEPIYDLGFVDECQDLSPARLALSFKICKELIFCGNEEQAINGFSGADPYSMKKVKERCDLVLPLKESFRIKEEHVALLNKMKPQIKLRSSPGNKGAITKTIGFDEMLDKLEESVDRKPMVICRFNAPLVEVALGLIKRNVPCKTLGKSLAERIEYIVKGRKAESVEDLKLELLLYSDKLQKKGSELVKKMNKDMISCIMLILGRVSTIADFFKILRQLTAPTTKTEFILLSTIHKAKGLEAPMIFILNPPVQCDLAKTPEEKLQEDNLAFVAYSRSQSELYLVV